MSEDWQDVAAAAWRDHRERQHGDDAGDAREALERLSKRLTVLGIAPPALPPVYADGQVRILLQDGRPFPVRHPDRTEPAQREVWACAQGRTLWLEASEDYGNTPALAKQNATTRLMHAGELATLADVGRALAGDGLTPLEDDAEPNVADQLLMVLRALIDDALADAMEGRL